jgi:hypothetical protein
VAAIQLPVEGHAGALNAERRQITAIDEVIMLRALFSRVSFLHRRVLTPSPRKDQLKSDSELRRERWNQVIAEHQKPLAPHTDPSKATGTVTALPPE